MIRAVDRHFGVRVYVIDRRIVIAVAVDRFGFFNESASGELLPSSTVRATPLGKVVVWPLVEKTMIGANDSDFRIALYILNLGIIITIAVNRFGFFNECFGGECLVSCAVTATKPGKVVGGCLLENTMIGANDRYFGFRVDVFNGRIVITVAVNRFGLFNKFICC